jgi:ribose transport system permease protein
MTTREIPSKMSFIDKVDDIKSKRFFPLVFPLITLAFLLILFELLTGGKFFTKNILLGIFNQSVITATMATAVAFIYSTGDIDFSVGSAMGLAMVFGALVFQTTGSSVMMVIVTLVSGLGLMLFNCVLGVTFHVKSSMVAIVAMSVYSAITVQMVGANPYQLDYSTCKALEGPFRYISFIAYFGICLLLYHKTSIGRKLRFIGGNETCSKQTGINIDKCRYIAYIFAGVGVGLAAVFQMIRTANVASGTGTSMGMEVMLATVLGGMSIFGGSKSNVYAGVIGAITVTVLNKGLLMMGVPSTLIQGARGIIFLLLVFLNSERSSLLPSRQQF